MDKIFDICVNILIYLGEVTGVGYKAINVLIFVFSGPIIYFLTCLFMLKLLRKSKSDKK